jgi:hypothetical protein
VILSEERIRYLLTEALECVDAPEGCGVVLEGSIAEGFGNETSDVDFLLLEPGDHYHPTMPSILFIDGARVEVRLRAAEEARRQAAEVGRIARAGPEHLLGIDEWHLDRCQRLIRGLVLENPELVDRARLLTRDEISRIVAAYFGAVARRSAHNALLMATLGEVEEAVVAARAALLQGVKSWVAERDEAYLEYKWIRHQLERAPNGRAVQERFAALDLKGAERIDVGTYVAECLQFLGELGIDECEPDAQFISLSRDREVTTWPLGSRVHVVRHRRDVIALGARTARAWRSIVFDVPLPDSVVYLDEQEAGLLQPIAEFFRLRLLTARWRGGAEIPPRSSYTSPPATTQPVVSLDGAHAPNDGEPDVWLVPLPADRFAAAGMALAWANLMIENAREDAVGALGREQWRVFETAARRMLGHACRALLTAYGVVPLPALEEAPLRLGVVGGLPCEMLDSVARLQRDLRPSDRERASALLAEVEQVVQFARDRTGTSLFPASFVSADEWRQTLEIGCDWVRLGAYLDSQFPVDEARDLLAGGGLQPTFRTSDTALERA